ncbi:hypothetical protein FRC18_002847 [Serendipita sp. 400]|nr:hypothetical protein FRC18_002847 [Serendipita sp. 400]
MSKSPRNWPQGVQYLHSPVYHSSIPPSIVSLLRNSAASSSSTSISSLSSIPIAPSSHIPNQTTIQKIELASHPAHGQLGLFASKKIPPNTMIIYYLGQVHAEQRTTSDYNLSLIRLPIQENISIASIDDPGYIHIGIDAEFMGNEARCINDYRGIAQRPNALFKEVKHPTTGQIRMSVWSGTKPIPKHEEILVSYGKGWWKSCVLGERHQIRRHQKFV